MITLLMWTIWLAAIVIVCMALDAAFEKYLRPMMSELLVNKKIGKHVFWVIIWILICIFMGFIVGSGAYVLWYTLIGYKTFATGT